MRLLPEPRLNENLPWKEVANNSSLYHVDQLVREKLKEHLKMKGRGEGGHITLWFSFWTI